MIVPECEFYENRNPTSPLQTIGTEEMSTYRAKSQCQKCSIVIIAMTTIINLYEASLDLSLLSICKLG